MDTKSGCGFSKRLFSIIQNIQMTLHGVVHMKIRSTEKWLPKLLNTLQEVQSSYRIYEITLDMKCVQVINIKTKLGWSRNSYEKISLFFLKNHLKTISTAER